MMFDIDKNSELVAKASEAEVKAKQLPPLPNAGETKEQVETFLAQGTKRLQQIGQDEGEKDRRLAMLEAHV